MDRGAFLAGCAALLVADARSVGAAQAVRIPMLVENNHIFAQFGFPAADGSVRPLLTTIDTGGGGLLVARTAANELGLKTESNGDPLGLRLAFEHLFIGSVRISIPFAATTARDSAVFFRGASAPVFFAASVLRDHAVTFDYGSGMLALDAPALDGESLPVSLGSRSSFPRVELTIDGETMGFLLDTGASFTMLSQSVIDRLRAKHPAWSAISGAYGPANMVGGSIERNAGMLRIPGVRWGPFTLEHLDVVSRPTGTFEKSLSAAMSAPIVGALGGNALRNFSLWLDYPHARLQARFAPRPWPEELTIVPLIVEPREDGSFAITGGAGAPDLNGNRLLEVDGRPVDGLPLYRVHQLLRGVPGTPRTLTVRAEGASPREIVLRTVSVL